MKCQKSKTYCDTNGTTTDRLHSLIVTPNATDNSSSTPNSTILLHSNVAQLAPTALGHDTNRRKRGSRNTPLSILQFNARSVLPKMSELSTMTLQLKPLLVAVSESWLSASVPDGAVLLPGYSSIVRADRSPPPRKVGTSATTSSRSTTGPPARPKRKQHGGGVLLLVHDSLPFTVRRDLQLWDESVWIEVQVGKPSSHGSQSLIVGCVYRAPDSDLASVEDFAQRLESIVNKINLNRTQLALVGDFNARSPSWHAADSYNPAGRILEAVFLRLGLTQCVRSPTHISKDGSLGSLLDLVLVSDSSLVSDVSIHPPLGSSDHLSVLCQLCSPPFQRGNGPGRKVWCFEKADFPTINKRLGNADWSGIQAAEDVDGAWTAWRSVFLSIVNKAVPSKIIKNFKRKNPCVTPAIEIAIKEKRAALRLMKKHPTDANRDTFKQKRNAVTHLLRKSERSRASTLFRATRLDPSPRSSRNFWEHAKHITGKVKQTVIPDFTNPANSSRVHLPSDKATLLNEYFVNQTVLAGASSAVPEELVEIERTFSSISTSPRNVFEVLSHLKENKAAGIDGLPPRLLKYCAAGIASSVADLFNRSFAEGHFPTDWKAALIVPIFKKGDRSEPGNYRPIALLPVISKVMERIVHNKLSRFLNPWLSPAQSGFKKSDGTVPQLTRLTQTWAEAIDRSDYIGVVFFDLRKAFDKIWHQGLLHKLRAAGVSGPAYQWLVSFLAARHQTTVVDGCRSTPLPLHAGVPQGAILSPLLFSVYMNDIPSPDLTTNLFADDTSVYIVETSAQQLNGRLQTSVDVLCCWFKKWLLCVNSTKTAAMVIRSQRMPAVTLNIKVDSASIPQVSSHRHLGLVLNESLSWSNHVDQITLRASQRIGMLRRLKHRSSSLVVRELYLRTILPMMEYASIVWSGMSTADAKRLERCNRAAGRVIAGICPADNVPSTIILARAGLDNLMARRNVAQAKFTLRLLQGKQPPHLLDAVRHNWLDENSHKSGTRQSLRDQHLLRLPKPNKNALKHSPLYISFSAWNTLPKHIRSSPSRDAVISFFSQRFQ